MKKKISGYDETKKMLNVLRKFSLNTMRINEEVSQSEIEPTQSNNQFDDFLVINDVPVKLLSTDKADMTVTDEQKEAISQLVDNFKTQVSQIANFDPGFTLGQKDIRLDGFLPDEDLSFVYVVGDNGGLYINAEMTKLDGDVKLAVEKLMKFEETFKTAMSPILSQRTNN